MEEILPFLHFVAGCQLHQLRDQIGVLVLGLMGAGKSTTIAVQQGAKLAVREHGGYQILASDVSTPRVSHGFESQTFNIGVFPDKVQKRLYFDTGGLNENRGKQEFQWTRFSLATTFSLLKEISCTLVVIDYGTSIGGCRGEGLRTVAKNLCEVIGLGNTSAHFYRSMAFVIANGFFTGRPITLERLRADLNNYKDSVLRRGKAKLESLKRNFPVPMSAEAMLIAEATSVQSAPAELGSLGALVQDARGIDFTRMPEEDPNLIAVKELQPVLALIDALESALAGGRVFLSFPQDAAACQQQRDSVNAMISRCSKIHKDQLKEIVASRVTEDLDVWNVLAAAAGSFHPEVARLVDLKNQVLSAVDEKRATLTAIEQDWQKVKCQMLQRMEDERAARKDKIEKLDREIRERSSSTRRVVFRKVEVRKSEEGNWWHWFLGIEKADHCLEHNLGGRHNPELWYKDYEVTGSNFGKLDEKEYGPQGKHSSMSVHLRSSENCDLNVDVCFYREEKDLPSTRSRVRDLQAEREELVKEQQVLSQRSLNLSVCHGIEDLLRFVLERETQLASEVQAIENNFTSEIEVCPSLTRAASPPKRGHTIMALAQLLGTLTRAGAQPQTLSPSAACTIEDFLDSVSTYEAQNQNFKNLKESAAAQAVLGEQAAILEADARAYKEATPPVGQPFSLGHETEWVEQRLPNLAVFAKSGRKFARHLLHLMMQQVEPGPLGAAFVAFAICTSILRVLLSGIFALGIFLLCKGILQSIDVPWKTYARTLALEDLRPAARALEDLRKRLREGHSLESEGTVERVANAPVAAKFLANIQEKGPDSFADACESEPEAEVAPPVKPEIPKRLSRSSGPRKVLREELKRSSEAARVNGLVQFLESEGAVERVEDAPVVLPVRIITRRSLLKTLHFDGNIQITIPGQTFRAVQSKGLHFQATLAEPRIALPAHITAASSVVELRPHREESEFPIPVLVEMPWHEELTGKGHVHFLSFFILEEEQTEWRKVPGGRFKDGRARIILPHFCQLMIAVSEEGYVEVSFTSWMRRAPQQDGRYDAKILLSCKDCHACELRSNQYEDGLLRDGFQRTAIPPDLDKPLDGWLPPQCRVCISHEPSRGREELHTDFDCETQLVTFSGGLALRKEATSFPFLVRYVNATGRLLPANVPDPSQFAAAEPRGGIFAAAFAAREFIPLRVQDPAEKDRQVRLYEQGVGDILDILKELADVTWFFCIREEIADGDPDPLEKLLKDQDLGELLIYHGEGLQDALVYSLPTPEALEVDYLMNMELVGIFRERLRRGLANPECLFLSCCNSQTRATLLARGRLGIDFVVYFEDGAINDLVVCFQSHFLKAVKERLQLFRKPLNYARAFDTAKRATEDHIRTLRNVRITSISAVMEKVKCIKSPVAEFLHPTAREAAAANPQSATAVPVEA